MTVKGSHKLIDALPYLKISGQPSGGERRGQRVHACATVHPCSCGFPLSCRNVCPHFLSLFLSTAGGENLPVTGWLQEIRCAQRITWSIWPGSGVGVGGEARAVMHQPVFQPDGVHSGGHLSACQQILIFHPPRAAGTPRMSASMTWVNKNKSILWWNFYIHLVPLSHTYSRACTERVWAG